MYSYIRGILTERDETGVVVDCNGLGFDLLMGPALAAKAGEIGKEVTLYTHFHVTQDNQQLFAFPDKESRKLFRLLITVSGIGPKAAMNVLEVFSPAAFAIHVMQENTKELMKAKGLGKKSAERIIIDLRDKLGKGDWGEEAKTFLQSQPADGEAIRDEQNEMRRDILEGLAFLGYAPTEAKRLLEQSFDLTMSLEENLKNALAAARQP